MREDVSVITVCAMLVGLALTVPVIAQSTPAYDAVSIKPFKGENGSHSTNSTADRYSASNVNLKSLIRYAWDLQSEDAVVGVTGWAESAPFDVEAKMDADTVAELKKLKPDDARAAKRKMMQAMLIERFKLKVHAETREQPIYVLVVAKGGPKLGTFDPNIPAPDGSSRGGSMGIDDGHMEAVGVTMDRLTLALAQRLHRVVVDKTGLTGKYDFSMDLPRDMGTTDPQEAEAAGAGPSIFTLLPEKLGLKLEATKGPVPVIVVDSVQPPTEN